MAQEYVVKKAFLSTDQETKEPQVIQTAHGDKHKYMVQVEGQPVQGWMGILKNIGNEVKVGDTIYGDITKNDWGKPNFKSASRPLGEIPQSPSTSGSTSGTPASLPNDLAEKIDFLVEAVTELLGQRREALQAFEAPPEPKATLADLDI